MNHFQFQKLIKNIPSIEVSLNWMHEEGSGNFEEEFQTSSLTVLASFSAYQTGVFDVGDYYTAPSFTTNDPCIDDIEANVYNKDGDEVQLSIQQKESLETQIKSSINLN